MKKLTTKEILKENLARQAPCQISGLKILIHNVRSLHNIGAAFRSADVFGIDEILLSGFSPTPPRAKISKTAIGAEKHVSWKSVEKTGQKIFDLKNEGYRIIGMEQTTNSKLLPDYQLSNGQKICLVFGNEVTGIDEELLEFIDEFVEIPQYGQKHSLNISVAVGVALYGFLAKCW